LALAAAGTALEEWAGAEAPFFADFSGAAAELPTICSLLVCSFVAATAFDAARFAWLNVDIACA
ncbi:MAG TPA: hypothetical protein VIR34_11310, partial [Gemmatimonadaceae bacterium]